MDFNGLPTDLDAEVLLSYLPENTCKVQLKGEHSRNAYGDVVNLEKQYDGNWLLELGRNSLYHALPEYMFHPIDRFDNLPRLEEKERFAEEYEAQEKEKENASRFFAPVDLLLLQLRCDVRQRMEKYVTTNRVLEDMLTDNLTEQQRSNRFIQRIIPFMPACKYIRGNRTLLTLLLRKVFREEGLLVQVRQTNESLTDEAPRYADSVGDVLGDVYAGNTFSENVIVYDVYFWSEDECNANFLIFVEELETLRGFIQDFFMAIEATINFTLRNDEPPLRLSDDMHYNYLNYNTNI